MLMNRNHSVNSGHANDPGLAAAGELAEVHNLSCSCERVERTLEEFSTVLFTLEAMHSSMTREVMML